MYLYINASALYASSMLHALHVCLCSAIWRGWNVVLFLTITCETATIILPSSEPPQQQNIKYSRDRTPHTQQYSHKSQVQARGSCQSRDLARPILHIYMYISTGIVVHVLVLGRQASGAGLYDWS
jgi:hypothetical protein